jgi:molybdenum cofactor cytidylyltransferase
MKPVVAVILAAGASARLGSPKQLALLGEEHLLDRTIRIAREAGCVPLVVLGAHAEVVCAGCHLDGIQTVFNSRWEEGMSTSIAVGIGSAQEFADAVLLMTCDQPAVTPAHLNELIAMGRGLGGPVASSYAGRNGVPAYFPAAQFSLLLSLRGDAGARGLLVKAQSIPLMRGELDIDTPEKLVEAQGYFPET